MVKLVELIIDYGLNVYFFLSAVSYILVAECCVLCCVLLLLLFSLYSNVNVYMNVQVLHVCYDTYCTRTSTRYYCMSCNISLSLFSEIANLLGCKLIHVRF